MSAVDEQRELELAGDRGDASNMVLKELGLGSGFKHQHGTQVDEGASSGPGFKLVVSLMGAAGGRRSERRWTAATGGQRRELQCTAAAASPVR
jgi:hypothetical protein